MKDKQKGCPPAHFAVCSDDFRYEETAVMNSSEMRYDYGICVFEKQTNNLCYEFRNVTESEEVVQNLLNLVAEENVEPCHLDDVIVDFIAKIYTQKGHF